MKKFIIGLGTGRCGTYSLYELFKHNGININHEGYELPWDVDFRMLMRFLSDMLYHDLSDVGFYWIRYVEHVVKYVPHAKFICLKRDMDKVVKSFDKRTERKNYWTDPASIHYDWDNCIFDRRIAAFPKYDLPKKEALAEYWQEYYRRAKVWELSFPDNFKVYETEDVLNKEEVQSDMLDFAGIKDKKYLLNRRNNESDKPLIDTDTKMLDGISCGKCDAQSTVFIRNRSYSILMYACDEHKNEVYEQLKRYGG